MGRLKTLPSLRFISSSARGAPDAAHPMVDPRADPKEHSHPSPNGTAATSPTPQHCGTHSCPPMAAAPHPQPAKKNTYITNRKKYLQQFPFVCSLNNGFLIATYADPLKIRTNLLLRHRHLLPHTPHCLQALCSTAAPVLTQPGMGVPKWWDSSWRSLKAPPTPGRAPWMSPMEQVEQRSLPTAATPWCCPVFGGAPRSPSPPCFEMDKVGSPKASAGRRPSFSLRPEPPRTMEVDGYVQEMWGHWRCRQVSPGSQAQGHHILTVRHGEVRENGAIVSDGVTPRITSDASPGFWALPPWVDVTAQPAAVRIN